VDNNVVRLFAFDFFESGIQLATGICDGMLKRIALGSGKSG
jgi:hypothetical protein